ncbi:HAD hydrolase-like protein [Prosthecochloris sp.]|uniref:HAD family hydrolase n=1 Tax=Prosthecochloris sp. TaxID=290513 RepID=UPI0025E8C06D|nr:HAD hydrolase-like protein [Prosthecochloris sp.]
MLKKLVLFDIDGTLLLTNSNNRRILIDALMAVYGTEGSARSHNFAGKMDSVIIYEVLKNAGLNDSHITEKFTIVKNTYIDLVQRQLVPEDIELMAGIPELLETLSERNDIALGLLTGNFEGSGRHKLALPAINHFFPFGAFADDAYHRKDLPAVAVERAYIQTGKKFKGEEVVIIGDTEHDITCARAIQAKCIAVATGTYSAERLSVHSPAALFDDFSDTETVVNRILTL